MEKGRRTAKETGVITELCSVPVIDTSIKADLSKTRRVTLNRFMQRNLFDLEGSISYEETKRRLEEGAIESIQYLKHLTGIDLTSYKLTTIPVYGKSKKPIVFSKTQNQFLLVYSNVDKSAKGITASELDIYNEIFYQSLFLRYKNALAKKIVQFNQDERYGWFASMEALGELFAILSLSEQPENRDKKWVDLASQNIDVQVARQFKELARVNPELSKTVVAEFEKNAELARQIFNKDGDFTAYVRQEIAAMPKDLSIVSDNLYRSIVIGHAIARVIYPYRSFVEMQIAQRVDELNRAEGSQDACRSPVRWIA